MTDIQGRTAVVTGAGSGIGRAIAVDLARAGCAVVIADIREDGAQAAAAEIVAAGGRALAVRCDVTDRASIAAMKAAAVAAFGPVSLLVANAGAASMAPFDSMSQADIDWILHANILGVIDCVQAFYAEMAAAGGGHIAATASLAGICPNLAPHHSLYAASKMGTIGFLLNLAIEARGHGVGVTVLCPGGVRTNLPFHNATYRPDRFGGPGAAIDPRSTETIPNIDIRWREPAEVSAMLLAAIAEDRQLVITDSAAREGFRQGYVKLVEEAFDHADRF